VRAGDIVATLDDDQQRLQLGEAEARLAGFAGRIAALRRELGAAEAAQSAMRRSGGAERAAANAQARGADASATFNAQLAQKQKADSDAGGAAPIDAERALADARRAVATRDAARADETRVAGAATARDAGLAAEVARINALLATAEAEQAATGQLVTRLRHDLELRTIRAPVDGIIAAVTTHRLGDVLAAGNQLATIVPDGVLHVVASFDPSTGLGRLAVGQTGRLRLDGFSWAEYGDVSATVERVAGEANDKGLRVELRVLRPRNGKLVLRHGMTGRVDVAIEQIAPATLLLRAIGVRFA
jgi:membrane fusion protein (multidrug efflux system)